MHGGHLGALEVGFGVEAEEQFRRGLNEWEIGLNGMKGKVRKIMGMALDGVKVPELHLPEAYRKDTCLE